MQVLHTWSFVTGGVGSHQPDATAQPGEAYISSRDPRPRLVCEGLARLPPFHF